MEAIFHPLALGTHIRCSAVAWTWKSCNEDKTLKQSVCGAIIENKRSWFVERLKSPGTFL